MSGTTDKPERYCKMSEHLYSHESFAWGKNGEKYNPVNPDSDDFPKMVFRVGKKAAGALLRSRVEGISKIWSP